MKAIERTTYSSFICFIAYMMLASIVTITLHFALKRLRSSYYIKVGDIYKRDQYT